MRNQDEAAGLIPASPSIVAKYILQILGQGRPRSRADLIVLARQMASTDRFTLGPSSATATVKKALAHLARQGLVISPRVGWWTVPTAPEAAEESTVSSEVNVPPAAAFEWSSTEVPPQPIADGKITVERQIGEGKECVYVYYHKAHAELASRNGVSSWECKIGWTVGDPDARVIGQGALTAFPRLPVIGLLIRTQDGRSLERLLHTAMIYAGRKLAEGGGTEWFLTSPQQVEDWYSSFLRSLKFLRKDDAAE